MEQIPNGEKVSNKVRPPWWQMSCFFHSLSSPLPSLVMFWITLAGLQRMVVLELDHLPFLYFLHVLLAHLVREWMSWFILNIFYVWNVLYPADRNLLETAFSMLKSASQDITITLTSHQVWNCSDRFQCLTQISDSLILQNNLGFESWLWCGHQFHFSRGNSSCTSAFSIDRIQNQNM